jgi:hypothetical protein
MRRQLLGSVTAFALAMGMTTSAMAFEHDGDAYSGGFRGGRFEGVRGFSGWRHGGDWVGRRAVGGYRSPYDSYGAGLGPDTRHVVCPAYSRCSD